MSLSHSPLIVRDGLVLCLDAANPRSYPKSGTTWSDLKGSNDGTLTNGPTFDADDKGSIVFDGSNDYVQLGQNSLNTSGPLTVDIVAKYTAIDSQRNLVVLTNGSAYTQFGVNGNEGRVWKSGGGALLVYSTPTVGQIAIWSLVLNGSNGISVYINGSLDASVDSASLQSGGGNSFKLGTWGTGAQAYGGHIYSFKAYNRALTAAEVLQNYNATRGRYGI